MHRRLERTRRRRRRRRKSEFLPLKRPLHSYISLLAQYGQARVDHPRINIPGVLKKAKPQFGIDRSDACNSSVLADQRG
jgi:hypothetical protein